jgi:hypothetical protein
MKFPLHSGTALNEIGVIGRGIGGRPFERFEVYPVEPEPGVQSLEPFVIIEKGPVEISPDIDPVPKALLDDVDVLFHVFHLFPGIRRRNAVLGYYERQIEARRVPEDLCETARVDLPSHFGKAMALDVRIPELDSHLSEWIKAEVDARIVIDAEEVEFVLDGDLDLHGLRKRELDDEDARPEGVDDRVIVKIVCGLFQEAVQGVPPLPGSEHGHIMREAYACAGNVAVNDVIGPAMAGEDVFKGRERASDVSEAGGRAALQIAAEQHDIGLVEGEPVADPFEGRHHHLRKAEKLLDRRRSVPGRAFHEPARMGKVVKGEHGLDTAAPQDIDDLLVVRDGLVVPGVFPRLDPAPFYGEAVGIDAEFLEEPEVLAEQPVVVRDQRLFAEYRVPGRPVRMGGAFKLEGRGGNAPLKIVREYLFLPAVMHVGILVSRC